MKADSSSSVGPSCCRDSLGTGVLPGKKFRMLLQSLLDLRARPGDPRLHGAKRHAQHAGNLVVGHAVHIAENNRHPHVVVERLDAFTTQPMELAGFGALLWVRRGDTQPDGVTGLVGLGHPAVARARTKVVLTARAGDLHA